jgi:hypothetical protein
VIELCLGIAEYSPHSACLTLAELKQDLSRKRGDLQKRIVQIQEQRQQTPFVMRWVVILRTFSEMNNCVLMDEWCEGAEYGISAMIDQVYRKPFYVKGDLLNRVSEMERDIRSLKRCQTNLDTFDPWADLFCQVHLALQSAALSL